MKRDKAGTPIRTGTLETLSPCNLLEHYRDHDLVGWFIVTRVVDLIHLRCDSGERVEAFELVDDSAQVFFKPNEHQRSQWLGAPADVDLPYGTEIIAQFNCHGYVFADSMYWIDNDQVDAILAGDGYSCCQPQEANEEFVVVYRHEGAVVHTAKGFRDSDGALKFIGKAGILKIGQHDTAQEAGLSLKHDTIEYWHRSDQADPSVNAEAATAAVAPPRPTPLERRRGCFYSALLAFVGSAAVYVAL